jgi:hypothetical protein
MNIGPGHWIFAALFMISFAFILAFSFRKDKRTHKAHYSNAGIIAIVIGASVLLLIIIKVALRQLAP